MKEEEIEDEQEVVVSDRGMKTLEEVPRCPFLSSKITTLTEPC